MSPYASVDTGCATEQSDVRGLSSRKIVKVDALYSPITNASLYELFSKEASIVGM
jgi:hypothetical protein